MRGLSAEAEALSEAEAYIEDATGHTAEEKLALYDEPEALAGELALKLLRVERVPRR